MSGSTTGRSRSHDKKNQSWRVQLFRACRDGNVESVRTMATTNPCAIHEHFCEGLEEWQLELESLQWYEFGEATCLYIASSYCQEALVRWLLENGVDREKPCYYGLRPLDVVGQCCQDAAATAATIRLMLTQEPSRPRAPIVPSCAAKLCYEASVKKVFQLVPVGRGGATKRRTTPVPKQMTETVATCKVSVSWPSYWLNDITSSRGRRLGGGVTYELHYRSREEQDWICATTNAPNKTITGLEPGELYDFKVRARNSAGFGDFSGVTELLAAREPKIAGAKSDPEEDKSLA